MKNTEAVPDQTARDLFGMMFDEGGVVVPGDDLAPAAIAGYLRYRRWRTAVARAGVTALLAGTVGVALMVGGARSGSGTVPGVWSGTETSPLPYSSASVSGAGDGRLVDCLSDFAAQGDWDAALKAQADCRRAEGLWRDVFPGMAVSGARNPSIKQVTDSFLARVRLQDASAPSLYGRAQPQVLEDWTEARQQEANAGFQSWSDFNITTAQGTVAVSAVYRSAKSAGSDLSCEQSGPCYHVTLSDNSVAEVTGTGDVSFTVTVRSKTGDSYRIFFTNPSDPIFVDVPCEAPGGHCYADLTDGSIRPGLVPDSEATTHHSVITEAMLIDILHRPAFARLVEGYFDSRLGQSGV